MIEFDDSDIRATAIAVLCVNETLTGRSVENVMDLIKDIARGTYDYEGTNSYVAAYGFMVTYYKAPGTHKIGVRTSLCNWTVNNYISRIQGALDTKEFGSNLVEVARDSHKAEREYAALEWKRLNDD